MSGISRMAAGEPPRRSPVTRARVHRRVTALVISACCALALPSLAGAHSFLIRSIPEAGSRLGPSPRELVLHFSEPFVRSSERVSVRRVGGAKLQLVRPTGGGTVVRQPLPGRLRGVFVVT